VYFSNCVTSSIHEPLPESSPFDKYAMPFSWPSRIVERLLWAAVVAVNKRTNNWESVAGLHSFEYLAKTKGSAEKDTKWDQVRKFMLAGSLSFWDVDI
jgi:hypothetical protein